MTENTTIYAHHVDAEALKAAYQAGNAPAKGLCGEDWTPVTSDVVLEMCPNCKEMYRGIYGVSYDS
jgi:hypothetical protein